MGVYSGVTIKTDTLRITPEILALVAEIDEFKGAWRALGITYRHHINLFFGERELDAQVAVGERFSDSLNLGVARVA